MRFEEYTSGWQKMLARDMATRCLAGPKALFSVIEALASGGTIFSRSPDSGALGRRLAENTPDLAIAVPTMIAQGLSDDLVLAQIQAEYVQDRCTAGQIIEYRKFMGQDHLSIVAPDSPLTSALVKWTQERFSGTAAPGRCTQERARS